MNTTTWTIAPDCKLTLAIRLTNAKTYAWAVNANGSQRSTDTAAGTRYASSAIVRGGASGEHAGISGASDACEAAAAVLRDAILAEYARHEAELQSIAQCQALVDEAWPAPDAEARS